MRRKTMSRIATAAILSAFGSLFAVNLQAMTTPAAAGEASYHWKFVANGVYHCTTEGELNCDTESAHSWDDEVN